ncbi:MAG: DUF3536 domain-containing protein [Elusimicrobiota bacterium]
MRNKYFCLHAHFDLPPRENPWLEETEPDPSALPYRDAFERAFHECYGPNSAAALLDTEGRALGHVNNYGRISFDFGPELLAWIERHQKRVYARILDADRAGLREHGGHGNALAAPYPSLILPLASLADKRAAVRWGLDDFQRRFRRRPEGLWLPENAVDAETLEVLIEAGVRFTLLRPDQAARVRPVGSDSEADWLDVAPETLDSTRPYRWRSRARKKRHIDIFFYRTDLSPAALLGRLPTAASPGPPDTRQAASSPSERAFDHVIEAGHRFATRIVDSYTANDAAELTHIAPDGEWFGLLAPRGERALAAALDALEREGPARRVSYGEFLDLFPSPQEVELRTLSSRSCPHGVGRWSNDCDCRFAPPPARPAGWREPLRAALDWLSARLDERFEAHGSKLFSSPARAREACGALAFTTETGATQPFLDAESLRHPRPDEARRAIALCEMQRSRLKMFCHWGWEDNDVSGLGPVQSLLAAARALDVLGGLDGERRRAEDLEKEFLKRLSKCPSDGSPYPDAAAVYTRAVAAARVDLVRAAAHYAVADHLAQAPAPSPLESPPRFRSMRHSVTPLCRRVVRPARSADRRSEALSLSVSRVAIRRLRTFETIHACAAVLHRGGTDIECRVLPGAETARCRDIAARLDAALLRGAAEDEAESFRAVADEVFGPRHFTLDALFPAARRQAARGLLPRGSEPRRRIDERWRGTLRRLARLPAGEVASRLREAADAGISPDMLPGAHLVREYVKFSASAFAGDPGPEKLSILLTLLEAAGRSGLRLNVWELQDLGRQGLERLRPDEDPASTPAGEPCRTPSGEARAGAAKPGDGPRRLASVLGLSEGVFLRAPTHAQADEASTPAGAPCRTPSGEAPAAGAASTPARRQEPAGDDTEGNPW